MRLLLNFWQYWHQMFGELSDFCQARYMDELRKVKLP
jgi:hypothetical protein